MIKKSIFVLLVIGINKIRFFFSAENGYNSTRHLLTLKEPPTAIFTLGNFISLGYKKSLKEAGLNIPGDMSLIAYDEQIYSQFLATPLTTIKQPIEDMANSTVNMLMQLVRNKKPEQHKIILHPEIIMRDSLGYK
ncbi:MAG: substrate-binding domain-containing protein [Bacteroidales bacterium]